MRPLPLSGRSAASGNRRARRPIPTRTARSGASRPAGTSPLCIRVDRAAAAQMLNEFVTSLQTHRKDGAPWQCVNPATKYTRGPQYAATVTAPYVALRTVLDPR